MKLILALKKHCALENEGLQEFNEQCKRLTNEDREWFKKEFTKMGVTIED